jgi:hypothetical protein
MVLDISTQTSCVRDYAARYGTYKSICPFQGNKKTICEVNCAPKICTMLQIPP